MVFESHVAPDLRGYFPDAALDQVSEQPIWRWTSLPVEGHPEPFAYHIVQLETKYLVLCHGLSDLKRVATGLLSRPNESAANDLQSSGLMSREYWGHRRYRHGATANSAVASALDTVTPSAKTLTLFVDFDRKSGVLRLSASDSGAAEKLSAYLLGLGLGLGPLIPTAGKNWETSLVFDGSEASFERLFTVMGLFGFGVYL